VAQRLAREKGVDLAHVTGTGPRGRITEADVLRFAGAAAAAPADELIPLSRLRKTISERMSRSAQTIPHFTLTVDADMTEALGWREQRADVDGRKPSVTALLVKAAADALRRFPQVNASLTDQGIRRHAHINVGVAVASDEGLVVPVVRDADGKAPSDISAELSRLQGKARALRFEAHEITGPPSRSRIWACLVSTPSWRSSTRLRRPYLPPAASPSGRWGWAGRSCCDP
jgi:pyruvate dehydrogenase E2 component (dihydrolipoamide acetyltransferase)